MKSARENPDSEENERLSRDNERAVFAAQQQATQNAQLAVVPCACVHSDATTCARWRDGFDTDDPRYERHRRQCECACHEEYPDDEEL